MRRSRGAGDGDAREREGRPGHEASARDERMGPEADERPVPPRVADAPPGDDDTAAKPEAGPAEPEPGPADPEAGPADPEAAPTEPDDAPARSEAAPARSGAAPARPEAAPAEPATAPTGEAAPPVDRQPLDVETPEPPARVEPVVVPRWIQLVALPLALLGLWALARAAGKILLVFLIAAVLALLLNPLVKLVQRARVPHGLAVLAVYVTFFGVLAGAGLLLASPVSDQVEAFQRNVPTLIDSANESLAGVQRWLDKRGIDVELKAPGQTALETLRRDVTARSGDVVAVTGEVLQALVEASFALVLVLVVSVYMLIYGPQIGALVRRVMPPGDGTPEDDYPTRAQKAVFGYVRGQILFSLIMGTSAGVSMWIFGAVGIFPEGRTYAFFFGAFYGLMELVPFIGPVLGALPPMIVALFGDPLTAVWLGLFFTALQQLEGHVVAPLVFGHSLRINPLLVIFALLIGGQLYGIVGALVALPIAAVARETAVYLRRHVVLEPWGTPTAAGLAGAGVAGSPSAAGGPPPPSPPCPACAATTAPGDAYCRACGAALRAEVGAPG